MKIFHTMVFVSTFLLLLLEAPVFASSGSVTPQDGGFEIAQNEDENEMDDTEESIGNDLFDTQGLNDPMDMRTPDCFLNTDCLKKRRSVQVEVDALRATARGSLDTLAEYFRTNLTDTEKSSVNAAMQTFLTDLEEIDTLYWNRSTSGTGITQIQNQVAQAYSAIATSLSSYLEPSLTTQFQDEIQDFLLDRINILQLNESRQLLTSADIRFIQEKINNIPLSRKEPYLTRVISRVDTLRNSITNARMTELRKERMLAKLDEIETLIQGRLDDLMLTGFFTPRIQTATGLTVTAFSGNTATISYTTTASGTLYYVVVPSQESAPSASQIRLGQNSLSQTTVLRGSANINSGTNSFPIVDLSSNTRYTAYFAMVDSANNLGKTVQSLNLSTTSGTSTGTTSTGVTSGAISSLFFSGTTSTGAFFTFTSTRAGMGYYVILTSGSSTPSATQVRAGQNGNGQLLTLKGSGSIVVGTNRFPISGLAPSSSYNLYFVSEDANGNLDPLIQNITFSTLSGTTNGTLTVSGISTTGTTAFGTTLSVTANGTGSGYYVALSSGATLPSPEQVKWGQNNTGQTAMIHGVGNISGASKISISGLIPTTKYVIYFIEEWSTGLGSKVQTTSFTTGQY